jgi:hypothetical protein
MKKILKPVPVFLLFVLISVSGNAQDRNSYQAFDAVLLQVNGDMQIESRLKKAVIALSGNSNQLNVRISIPYHSINYVPDYNTLSEAPDLLFSLKININPWQVQDNLTSAKVFTTSGLLTLNNITHAVMVDYIPFPAGTDMNGDFRLSMIVQFTAGEFELDAWPAKSKFIIKIGDARVNRP